MNVIKAVNAVVSFALELVALGVFGYYGYQLDLPGWARIAAAVALPLLLALLWGIFAAPRSERRLSGLALLAFKVVVFGAAVLALYALGYPLPALVLAAIALVNLAIEFFVE